jgi:cold shock CspA family protein
MKGYICKYLDEKGFGFVMGDDGKEYFFHISQIINKQIEVGHAVDFNPAFNKKGYNAQDITVGGELEKIYKNPSEFIAQKSKINDSKYKIFSLVNFTTKDRDPNVARQKLINKAISLGLNSALDIQTTRHTESQGNYQYTVHELSSGLCLVKEISFTTDKNEALRNDAEIKKELEEIHKKIAEENKRIELSKENGCLGLVLIFFLFPSAILFLINWIKT